MDDSAQEELVGLIFGENPPDGWRDMPEFQIYLSELGQLRMITGVEVLFCGKKLSRGSLWMVLKCFIPRPTDT